MRFERIIFQVTLVACLLLLNFSRVNSQQRQMTLEDAIIGRSSYLRPDALKGLTWKNKESYSIVKDDTLWVEQVKKQGLIPVITLDELNRVVINAGGKRFTRFPGYSWNENQNMIISHGTDFYIIDPEQKEALLKIILPADAENAVFSEEGRYVAYTVDNNLFVSFDNGEKRQVTSDGAYGLIYGKAVHRNEFGINGGIFISPKANYIAFYRMDESMVHDYPLVDFMQRQAESTPVKYPMAGMVSHHVSVGIYDVASKNTSFLKTGEPLDHYLTNIAWQPNELSLFIAELNREQDHMQMNRYNIETGEKARTLFEEKNDRYVEPLFPVQFSDVNETELYYLSRRDGWFHLYKYNTEGKLIRQITSGNWEVTRVIGFDKSGKNVFVEGTRENPLEVHIYKVDTNTGKTVKLSEGEGIHSGSLSPEGNYLTDTWEGPDNPGQTDLISADGRKIRTLFKAADPLEHYLLGENTLVSVPSADGKYELTGRLITPVNFDPSKKYPVIVYVYGGPHSQMVTKSWHNAARWWQYYMASQGYIAFTMDNRGTLNQGRDFETAIHRQLGILETQDQMQGIKYLKSLPYVDQDRIGVHGWSYGGFMTLNLMMRHPETFKVGVAGGPVVDWSMYEVMYGERYMDTPEENPKGYEMTDMTRLIPSLEGKLMLIHGVQDETVVMQHSMKFLREAVAKQKQVDFFAYPTHPHNVRGKDRIHLMEKVSNYFIENL